MFGLADAGKGECPAIPFFFLPAQCLSGAVFLFHMVCLVKVNK